MNYKPKKELGQNFLKNTAVAEKMVKSLDITSADTVIEIGPGKGALTKFLIDQPFKELALSEIDGDMQKGLTPLISEKKNTNLIIENFLRSDLKYAEAPFKVIGSLPYYITSPIIHKLLEIPKRSETMVFLVQKEVGEKMVEQAPRSSYWTHITTGYHVEMIQIVKAAEFFPVPKVDSAVIMLSKIKADEEIIMAMGFKVWEKFLHHAYKNPRKMLSKAFDKDNLEKAGVKPTDRPQNLTLQNLLDLYKIKALYTQQ